MTLDGLETIIWRKVPQLTASRPADRRAAMDAILAAIAVHAAAEHAAPDPAMTIRQARDKLRSVHLDDPGGTGRQRPACRVHARWHVPVVTTDPAAVTCHGCTRTAAYGAALDAAA